METRKHTPRHKGTCCRHIFAILPAVNQKDQGDKIFWTDYVLRSAFHEAVSGWAENKVLRLFEQCSTLQVVKHFRNFSISGNVLLKMWYNVQFAQVTQTTFWLITSLMNQRRISFDMMSKRDDILYIKTKESGERTQPWGPSYIVWEFVFPFNKCAWTGNQDKNKTLGDFFVQWVRMGRPALWNLSFIIFVIFSSQVGGLDKLVQCLAHRNYSSQCHCACVFHMEPIWVRFLTSHGEGSGTSHLKGHIWLLKRFWRANFSKQISRT